MITAKIIADSKSPCGDRITTFVLVFPRIVLAEFNTHRMLSRNSASSRAIPFEKMLKMVEENPFVPIKWMKDHKGMQGNEYFDSKDKIQLSLDTKVNAIVHLKEQWLIARDHAVSQACWLSHKGLTKQIVNRLLEPFMWHTVIVTATDWQNFFALRAHDAAEIHISDLAYKMLDAYNESIPKKLEVDQWHIPFGDNFDQQRVIDLIAKEKDIDPKFVTEFSRAYEPMLVKISTARCARVSYNNFEGKDDYDADVKLHDTLLSAGHMSPFEHCATPNKDGVNFNSGNFTGFTQYRKLLDGENKMDGRVKNAN